MQQVTFRIKRYNPEVDVKPHFEEYQLEVETTDRVLDALNKIKWSTDGTLTYRRSCAHGICGSDAMRINGRNRLACKVLMGELGQKITIEPLIGFHGHQGPGRRHGPFFDAYKSVKPYLIADDAPVGRERYQARRARPLRGHDQVHPLRGMHDGLPGDLDQRGVRRSCRDRQCRTASSSTAAMRARPSACAILNKRRRRLAVPDRLQLHRGLPARYQGHEGDRGSETRADPEPGVGPIRDTVMLLPTIK